MGKLNEADNAVKWYAMRDLKRHNAKEPAYKLFEGKGIEVFTPMKWLLITKKGKRTRVEVPFIPDLLFVRDSKLNLDSIVKRTETLQFRYVKGGYCVPMVVPDADMERFIHAVKSSESPKFFFPEEVTPQMYGHKIRIVGGPLDTYEGSLLTTRGSKVKRLLVELKGFLTVGVEVNPDLIELL